MKIDVQSQDIQQDYKVRKIHAAEDFEDFDEETPPPLRRQIYLRRLDNPEPPLEEESGNRRLPTTRTGGRKLPPTPKQPSTLNIDLLNSSSSKLSSSSLLSSFNFPKLNPSPSRNNGNSVAPAGTPRSRGLRRSIEDPELFKEAVMAGRGSRQLPLQPGLPPGARRSEQRPYIPGGVGSSPKGKTGFTQGNHIYSESDDEDWC